MNTAACRSIPGRPDARRRSPRSRQMEPHSSHVDDISTEVARLRAAGVEFRNDAVSESGGSQILLKDPSGNLIELFQPARH